MATRPGAWRFGVSARTGQPDVTVLRLSEIDAVCFSVIFEEQVISRETLHWLLGSVASDEK